MTEHSVLYRKYRPHGFDQVVGQSDIVKSLSHTATEKNPAHAYLFCGGRGTGKTSTARIFARALGVDESDIYEMDAASHRGVDDVRELRQAVHTMPLSSPYKVYILDEVHMLTKEAFNALLKVLEEPPQHVIFILATTELERIPDTIRSRCQVHMFARPTAEILTGVATDVASREGVTLDAGVAEIVARSGDGSFRDTLGALQKVLTSGGDDKVVTLPEATRLLGRMGDGRVRAFLTALLEKSPETFSMIENLSAGQCEDLILSSADYVRGALIRRYRNDESETAGDASFDKSLIASPAVSSVLLGDLIDTHAALRRSSMPALTLLVFVTRQFEAK
jgi:DNA polymerase III subunit gamma/tau